MHRKPEPKSAAKLLSAAFAAQGVTLNHQACLNLVAQLDGYESFAHLKAAQAAAPEVPVPGAPGSVKVRILFGEAEVSEYENANPHDEQERARMLELENQAREFSFDTEAERTAFLQGVDEATGWLAYREMDR
jgi:hypothetical protein